MLSVGFSCRVYFSSLKKARTKKLQCHFEALQLPCLTEWHIILLLSLLDAPVLWQVRHALLHCAATVCLKSLFNFVVMKRLTFYTDVGLCTVLCTVEIAGGLSSVGDVEFHCKEFSRLTYNVTRSLFKC
jgi:hypothetical protein